MTRLLPIVLLLALFGLSCGESTEKRAAREKEDYRKAMIALEEKEKANPGLFLIVSTQKKRNLIGQTVVQGQITSNAKVCLYKDVRLALHFYSKTGTLLLTTNETVYDNVAPGSSVSFKTKEFAPKGADSVAVKVLGAKAIEQN